VDIDDKEEVLLDITPLPKKDKGSKGEANHSEEPATS
jgi:hypothetical protein